MTNNQYRGYTFKSTSEGGTHIYFGDDLVATYDTMEQAKRTIDEWQDAR